MWKYTYFLARDKHTNKKIHYCESNANRGMRNPLVFLGVTVLTYFLFHLRISCCESSKVLLAKRKFTDVNKRFYFDCPFSMAFLSKLSNIKTQNQNVLIVV